MAGYDSAKRAAAPTQNKPTPAPRATNHRPAKPPQATTRDTTPAWAITQFRSDLPKGEQNPFVGSGWKATMKDGSPIVDQNGVEAEDLFNLTLRISECVIAQDKDGNDVVYLQIKPHRGKTHQA